MSQRDMLRSLDADIHAAFAAAGLAETGQYVPPGGGAAVTVRVDVDEAQQAMGEYGQSIGYRTVIGLLLEDVTPAQYATLTIDGTSYKPEAEDRIDQSIAYWVVGRG